MGAVHFTIDPELVRELAQALPLSTFVETGTFEGLAVQTVRTFFDTLYTVELSDQYFASAAERFGNDPAVHVCHGNSPLFLERLAPVLKDTSALYWLDAHWCMADGTLADVPQCPLLGELEAIESLNAQSVLLIDDARLFLCPPPAPHQVADWPSFDSILSALRRLSAIHQIMVVNDVIVYFPSAIIDAMSKYAVAHAVDWLAVLNAFKQQTVWETERDAHLEGINRHRQDVDAYQHTTKRLLVTVLRALRLV